MTPAERARLIDKQEYEAECKAIRERAFAMLATKTTDKRVREWINRDNPKPTRKIDKHALIGNAKAARSKSANAKLYTAFNHTRTLKEWAEETGILVNTIRARLAGGWTIEKAVTRSVQMLSRPGVVSNLGEELGTGAGSTAQETPNITFSGNQNASSHP